MRSTPWRTSTLLIRKRLRHYNKTQPVTSERAAHSELVQTLVDVSHGSTSRVGKGRKWPVILICILKPHGLSTVGSDTGWEDQAQRLHVCSTTGLCTVPSAGRRTRSSSNLSSRSLQRQQRLFLLTCWRKVGSCCLICS